MDIEWAGVTRRVKACNAAERYAGQYLENTATIAVSVSTPSQNFEFVSDPATWEACMEPMKGQFDPNCDLGFGRMDLYRIVQPDLISTPPAHVPECPQGPQQHSVSMV